ncbi:hypothetical protein C2845_PM06G17240 [Panicum miliaceum]|uniref:PGG domain-containing protein n=1 Tax=Panicum miliaceum TaxID=4540 RepID=A0A3L6R6X6_PANMI|nr:hypothetical protein C2845_PM06G17240 [Panicum miliaceum]
MVPLIILLTRYPACAGLRDPDGRTFLHFAVQKKRLNVVSFVCRWWGRPYSKSVVNVQDKNGDTALHIAVRDGELDMARWLIGNRHSRINLQNNAGRTPMDLANGGVKSGFYFGLPLTMPGGVWSPGDAAGKKLAAVAPLPMAGMPVLTGSYAFEGFVVSNTLTFICSTLATFSLVYCGVAAVDIQKRIELVSFSLALLLCSARSFSAAFAFALYLLLANVEHGTAIASCVMTSLALLDGFWFLMASFNDMSAFLKRKTKRRCWS